MTRLKSLGRRRRFGLLGITAALAVAFGLLFVAASSGAPTPCPIPGGFEIDGDMTAATCAPPGIDWSNAPGVQATTQGGTYSTSGKDGGDPSTWVSSGSTPPKTDFAQAYATSEVYGGHFYVFVAWERTSTTGTQGYAIEVDNSGSNVGSDGTPQPNRSGGGAVFYISSQGSSAPTFASACSFTSQSTYGQTCTSVPADVTAAINTASMSDPLNNTTQPAGAFFEVALDVTAVTGIVPSCPGATADSVYLRSITGQTKNGNLKGYMAPLDVAPNSTCVPPPITTTATPGGSTNLVGTAQHDTVTVGGDGAVASGAYGSGSVKFFLCSPSEVAANGGDCSANGTQVGSTPVTLNSSGFGTSATVDGTTTPNDNTPGKYCWRAEFTPDANDHNYLAGSETNSTTECFSVQAQPSIVTTQNPATGAINGTYGDTATLSDGMNYDGKGSITFKLYSNSNCTGLLDTETATGVSKNGDYSTPSGFQIQNAGTYYWVASYSGDSNNNPVASTCAEEPVTVNPAQPGIVTTQDPATGAINGTYKDTATLSGGVNYDGKGSITFKLYSGQDCQGAVLDTETVTGVSKNGDYSTPTGVVLTNTGTYYWVASFSGDSNNQSAASLCNDEPVRVYPNQPAISTTQDPASGPVNGTYKDTATLSGGASFDKTGSITFTLYSAKDCGGTVLDTERVTGIGANGDYSTPKGIPLANAGTYYWVASFSGDSNNAPVASLCNDEPVTVNPAQPSIKTTQAPAEGAIGGTYKDTATLSGAIGLKGTGSITFKLYSAKDCGGTVLDTETATGISANGTYSTPKGIVLNSAGTYYWVATFSGDSNNVAAGSGCNDEPVIVDPNTPTITTSLSTSNGFVGDTVHDSATLSGATASAGGQVTYTLYSDSTCTTKVGSGGTVTVTGGSVPNSTDITFNMSGTYYWQAAYTGDPNNRPATSVCTDERLIINVLTPPPTYCTSVTVHPKQLYVGRAMAIRLKLTSHGKVVKGLRVKIKGPKISVLTKRSNAHGVIKLKLNPKQAGIVTFKPYNTKACNTVRVGITGVLTPPVTG